MQRIFVGCVLLLLAGCTTDKIIENSDGLALDDGRVKNFGSPFLHSYQSCDQLSKDLKETALREMRTRLAMKLKQVPSDQFLPPTALGGPPPMPPSATAGTMEAGVDFSGTNNQEKGVDEADIIKTDGKYFYILSKSSLEILQIGSQGELTLASSLSLENPGSGILLSGDQAVILTADHWHQIKKSVDAIKKDSFSSNTLRVDVIDLSADRKNPKIVANYNFQGNFVAARTIGKKIHIATYLDIDIPNIDYYPQVDATFFTKSAEEKNQIWSEILKQTAQKNEQVINGIEFLDFLPTQLESAGQDFLRSPIDQHDCAHVHSAQDSSSNGFLNLITLQPDSSEQALAMQWVRGNKPIIYASPDQFIVASPEHQPWWYFGNEELKDQTTIHRFKLSDESAPSYADSVRVLGTLHNSFSLSEYQGYLRLVTTTAAQQRFWLASAGNENAPKEENHLFIVGDNSGKLEIISSLLGLAPGEKIWSARFSKDKGFLVTFKRIDPLFTLDLSDPKNPRVAGELKVPGVSTYLQDIGNNQVLAVGLGGDGDGLDFNTSVSLFDVSDFNHPQLAHTFSFAIQEGLNKSWSPVSSEANSNHLAINYFAPAGMTAIPLKSHRYITNPLDSSGGQYQYISKLAILNTVPTKEITLHGEIDHSKFYNHNSYNFHSPEIRRSYFVGDFIFAISPQAITANRLTDLAEVGIYKF